MKTNDVSKKTEWINLLLSNGGNTKELEAIRANSRTDLFALCKYKKILRNRDGRGKVELTEIESSYTNNDISILHKLLNEMFLEYFTKDEITNFLNLMKETSTSIKQIYDRHIEEPENNILSHLSL